MPAPVTYFDAVRIESMDIINRSLNTFFQDYDPANPTVILLPGGLGSTLHQSDATFNGYPQNTSAFRSIIWVNLGLLWGEALRLPIDTEGLDTNEQIVIAEGDLDYCLVHPYRDAVKYFREELNLNVLVVGWDWRRKVMTSVKYLEKTLTEMRTRALNLTGQNILHDTFLVGHSMGGMVAKLLMSTKPTLADELRGMISVGTPFYGYFGQLDRFYNGVEYFNTLYTAPVVANITSSWPGMYSLLPIDKTTYDHSHTALGLTSYPVVDADSGAPIDPYSPSSFSRYPTWARTSEIPRGLDVRHVLAAALPGSLGQRVHHLRVTEANTTQASATWKDLPFFYVPGITPSPVDFQLGPGDDTIPAWSAILASTPAHNIHDFDEGEHAFLMEERPILAKIGQIITGQTITASEVIEQLGKRDALAEKKEVEAIIRAIKSGEITPSQKYNKEQGKRIVHSGILRRMMAEYGL